MSISPEQATATPKRRKAMHNDDPLNLALATKQSTTILEVKRDLALQQAKNKLGVSQAEWLRLQQELLKFLKHDEGMYSTDEDAAYAFLDVTGAKDRFFGMLAGGEADGMLVNRGGLAWGIDDDKIIPIVAAIVTAWRPSASLYSGDEDQAMVERTALQPNNDHQTRPAKRKVNAKVVAMLPAHIVEKCGITAADYDDDDSLFLPDERRTKRLCSTNVPLANKDQQKATHSESCYVSGKGRTPTMPVSKNHKSYYDYFLAHWPAGFTFDVSPSHSACVLNPTPTAPKPWLRVCLYVGGERYKGRKLLMLDRITSLGGLSSQFCNAYHYQLQNTRRKLRADSIRFYIVHYSVGGSGSVFQVDAHDDKGWKLALDTLHHHGGVGRVVLRGYVEVHF
ncbi:MAG: hypothetical protein M1830_003894 [Pleopsidium flavum]|nr:MAG: hypothetical protein M1830_003894 [Pleopsidium flavum]